MDPPPNPKTPNPFIWLCPSY